MSLDLVQVGFAAVAPRFGEGVRLIGGFVGGPVVPRLPEGWLDVRLVVALPAERIAGLRPWRDSITKVVKTETGQTLQVNAREAGTWARMMLRGHGGTLATVMEGDGYGDRERLQRLTELGGRCSNEETAGYFQALGKPEPAWSSWPDRTPPLADRAERMEEWISACRR